MEEKRKVPRIRFKGYTDDWEQRKLGELVIDTIDNRGKNPPYYCESGIPIIDNFMIKNNGYPNLKIATRYLDNYLFNNFIRKYNEIDDVLITLVGNGIGNIALFPKEKSAIIQNTIGLRFNDNKKFMYYSLLSKNNEIIKLDRGMAQPSIRQDELKGIEINLPNIIEKNKIANLMTNIDNLITLHQRKCDKLVAMKKSLLEKMFPKNSSKVPEIRFKGYTDDWEQRKLGDTKTFYTDGNYGEAYPKEKDLCDESIGVPFLRGGNLKGSYLTKKDTNFITKEKHNELQSGHLKNDDIVIAVRGTIGSLGLANPENEDWNINSQLAIIRTDKEELYGIYLVQFLLSNRGQAMLHSSISGSALKQLPIGQLKNINIPITSLDEQKQIGKYFKKIDNLITLHQRKLEKLKNIKKSMLEKMFI